MAARSNHRLLVDMNRCRSRSASAARSSGNVWAVSRRMMRPSRVRTAKCPPLRSLAVRGTASMANGAPLWANHPATRASGEAPRLSELETNTCEHPSSSSVSIRPVA